MQTIKFPWEQTILPVRNVIWAEISKYLIRLRARGFDGCGIGTSGDCIVDCVGMGRYVSNPTGSEIFGLPSARIKYQSTELLGLLIFCPHKSVAWEGISGS